MEKNTLDDRKLNSEVLKELRKRAIARVQSRKSLEVIQAMGFPCVSISNWLAMYHSGD